MQNEYYFENSNMERENEEKVVDHWDAIYTLLRKWPLLLAGMLCGAVLLGAYSVRQSRRAAAAAKPVSIEERVESARAGIGETGAAEVEGLFMQYQEYRMLQSLLRNQQSDYLRDLERVNNSYMKTIKYLCSSEDAGPAGIFELQTVLSEDVCTEIGKITEGDGKITEVENNEIDTAAISSNRVLLSVDQNYKLAVSSQEILPTRYILTLRIIGDDKSQCDQIQTVIERKMEELRQAYVDAGGRFEMAPFASEYAQSAADLVKDTIVTLSGQLKNVTDNLNSLQLNNIDKLDDNSKAYFELLKEQDRAAAGKAEEGTGTNAKANASLMSLISKKLVVVGALAGIFLMVLVMLLQYILTRELQSKASFVSLCGSPLTAAVYKKGPSSTGLRMKLYSLFHAADELTRGKAAAIAQDMGIELEKKKAGSLYLLLSDNTEELTGFAKTLSDDMHSQHPNLTVFCGNPLNDQEQMKKLSDADAAVLLVELKKARGENVVQQLQMCGRYQVPVMGSVTLEVV